MTVNDARMRELIKAAPHSLNDFLSLLYEGLNWPLFDSVLEPEDLLLDWTPEELHLDPSQVARLASISQIPKLTANQRFGAFHLRFEGGQLPIGAIRRLVQRLVTSKRGKSGGKLPTWQLDDLLFFCISDGADSAVHVVNFREQDGKRVLRVLSWNDSPTETRMSLLVQRSMSELRWASDEGPKMVTGTGVAPGFAAYREGIKSAKALSRRMAEVAQDVRDEVRALLAVETESGPMRALYSDVQERLIGDISADRFADVYAQTMVYGLLTARIAHPEQFKAERSLAVISFDNEFLDAIYSRFRDDADGVIDVDELGLADLAEALANTDVDELLADFGADNQRDDPVVYFYEEFLAQYDPQQRKDLGAFYTPKPVVRYIVKTVDDALKSFGLPLGVADDTTWAKYVKDHPDIEIPASVKPGDPVVSMFDPANGTGTFLVEWLEQARKNAGEAGVEPALRHSSALEISLASYAVSHLKVSLDLPQELRDKGRLPIFLGDTLGPRRLAKLTGMDDPVGIEGVLANEVKFDRHHNVVVGNPPYDRDASAKAGFITDATSPNGRSLFDDVLDDAKKHVNFSHTKSLNDLYVYFWRWAIWKALEVNEGPGVVSMITSSSWLSGPGFLGLRRLAREVADEIYVLDLGGAGRGARVEENVFDIQTPVAIVTLVRKGRPDRASPAATSYRRVRGSRAEKLAEIDRVDIGEKVSWESVAGDWHSPLAPPTGDDNWLRFPAAVDLFPWQQPGCQFGRTSPVSPSAEALARRWAHFVGLAEPAERILSFAASITGRNVYTKVPGRPRLVDEKPGNPPPPIVRYSYRSFDRQWAFEDPRWAKTESPSLWASLSEGQIFMTSLFTGKLGAGPAATLATSVPDFHHFRGSYGGKDVLPLYRDSDLQPNSDQALLDRLTALIGEGSDEFGRVTTEDLFSYVFGILAGADYSSRFHMALETPGPRIPISRDPGVFRAMAEHGRRLVWLQTFGVRFATDADALSTLGLDWRSEPTRPPADKSEIVYDSLLQELRIADGVFVGIQDEVYAFEVSGMPVITKWLSYRLAKPSGKAASSNSPLDGIRPENWSPDWSTELVEVVAVLRETLAMLPVGAALLDSILLGSLISAEELPSPPDWLRKPPSARGSNNAVLPGM
jgi:hypothetical protein